MSDYGRRLVVDAAYDTVIRTLNDAIRAEGMEILAEVDVREHFGRKLVHDFRRYAVVQAWSPEIAMDVLRHDLDAGTVVATTFAVYELADGETAVVANGTFAAFTEDSGWRGRCPTLAALADRETRRLARVFDGIERAASRRSRVA